MQREVPGTRWLLAKSDFISREELASMAAARDGRVIEGETSRLEQREGGDVLISEREAALRHGMNDFLSKPIDPDRLAQALARWVRRERAPG